MATKPFWDGPYAQAYSPSDLINPKSIVDNGRAVFHIALIDTKGSYSGGKFNQGSCKTTMHDRDAYPLIEKGDIIRTYVNCDQLAPFDERVVAMFICEDIDVDISDDGTGSFVFSGPGLSKELQRKIHPKPFISTEYSGTSGSYTDAYVFLDAAHAAAEDFYNGGVIFIDGKYADIMSYASSESRVYVDNWRPAAPTTGSADPYTIYLGNDADDITNVLSNSITWWTSSHSGTPNGSFHNVNGRKIIDVIRDITEQTGWECASRMTYLPERKLYWFDANAATPVDGGLRLVDVRDYPLNHFWTNQNYGPVLKCKRRLTRRDFRTRVTVASSDGLTLSGLTGSDITIPTGYGVDFANSTIINTAVEAALSQPEISEESKVFGDISAASDTPEAKKDAKIRIYNAGLQFLISRAEDNRTYDVRTVLLEEPNIGESLHLKWSEEKDGELVFSVDADLWIREIAAEAAGTNGVRFIDLVVGEKYFAAPQDGSAATAAAIKNIASGGGGAVAIVTGGAEAPGAHAHAHGDLTDLGLDQHTQYLRADGTRSLTGNMLVSQGVTIDGVDISEHAGDPNAHHTPAEGPSDAEWLAHVSDPDAHHTPGTSITIVPGPNMQVQESYNYDTEKWEWQIGLRDEVEIGTLLRLSEDAQLEMPDHGYGIFRQVRIGIKGDQPYIEFADSGDWGGSSVYTDWTQQVAGEDVLEVPSGTTVDFTDISTLKNGWTITAWQWVFSLNEANATQYYADTQNTSRAFTETGEWIVRLYLTTENLSGDVFSNYGIKRLMVT